MQVKTLEFKIWIEKNDQRRRRTKSILTEEARRKMREAFKRGGIKVN